MLVTQQVLPQQDDTHGMQGMRRLSLEEQSGCSPRLCSVSYFWMHAGSELMMTVSDQPCWLRGLVQLRHFDVLQGPPQRPVPPRL